MKTLPCLVAVVSLSLLPAFAAPPDAGQLLREQQSQTERQLAPKKAPAETTVPAQAEPAATGPSVRVKMFRFRGNEGIVPTADLMEVVKGSVGKELHLADLQRLADKVTELLRSKGFFLSRAYLPKQDVTDGTVLIAIVQAMSDGEVGVSCAKDSRVHEPQLKHIAAKAVKPGQPLREDELERAILLMNDIPGVTARATLAPGSVPGSTKVTINVTETPVFGGALWADNYGNRYTGAWRGNGYAYFDSPFHFGDQANLMVSFASRLAQGRLGYGAPIGSSGLRGNISYTFMQYKLGEELAAMQGKGSASTADAGLSYPLIRRRALNLSVNAGVEAKTLKDKAYGYTIRDKRLQNGSAGISGDASDSFLGGGYSTWTASVTTGHLDLSHNTSDYNSDQGKLIVDNAGNYLRVPAPHTDGNYTRFNLGGTRLQRVTDSLSLYASYQGQLASKNLDSSEKFALGGPYGVRAYPVGEASGDEGHLFNFELRDDLPFKSEWGVIQVIGFFDAGYVTLYKNPWPGAVDTKTRENEYWLTGAGVGVGMSKPGLYSVRMNYAYKIGDNPGRSTAGKDADGRDDSGRLWLMGQVMF